MIGWQGRILTVRIVGRISPMGPMGRMGPVGTWFANGTGWKKAPNPIRISTDHNHLGSPFHLPGRYLRRKWIFFPCLPR